MFHSWYNATDFPETYLNGMFESSWKFQLSILHTPSELLFMVPVFLSDMLKKSM